MKGTNAIRWILILLLGGYGLFSLADSIRVVWRPSEHGWLVVSHSILLMAIVPATFLVPAFFLYRRQYRQLVVFLSVVAAFLLLGVIFWMMRAVGLHELLADSIRSTAHSSLNPVPKILVLLLGWVASLLMLVGPFMIVIFFVRIIVRFTKRRFAADHDGSKPV